MTVKNENRIYFGFSLIYTESKVYIQAEIYKYSPLNLQFSKKENWRFTQAGKISKQLWFQDHRFKAYPKYKLLRCVTTLVWKKTQTVDLKREEIGEDVQEQPKKHQGSILN